MNRYFLYSLQGRYTAVTILLAAFMLVAAYLAQDTLQDTRSATTENIHARKELLKCSRLIRDSIRKMQLSLTTFLVDPGAEVPRQDIQKHLADAKKYTDLLWQDFRKQKHQNAGEVTQLRATLDRLESDIGNLIELRTNIDLQYPSLTLVRDSMATNHAAFNFAVVAALNDAHENSNRHHNMVSYDNFTTARQIWNTMITKFHMYIANQLASFDTSTLPTQERVISAHYNSLQTHLDGMQEIDSRGGLGKQGSASLATIQEVTHNWFNEYQKVLDIHHKGIWRSDIGIIRQTITPQLNSIWTLLFDLDNTIEESANQDVGVLTGVAETQTRVLWLFVAFCTLFLVVGFVYFQRTVLRPLKGISEALKSGNDDIERVLLPTSYSRETQDLMDSFVEMRTQVRERQQALEYNALHDGLTNLANRTCLNEHLEQSIRAAKRQQGNLALMILDLDHFKEVNDTLGHQLGDQLLIKVSERLSALMRTSDVIARFGGDEFAILLPDTGQAQAILVADKIVDALLKPFHLSNQQLYIGASIGISIYPQHGLNVESLTQHSDIAMYQAKRNKTGWALYQAETDEHSLDRLELMNDLRTALLEKTLQLYFQPKIRLADGFTESVEALLRWQHPKHGFIRPDLIVSMAEQTGLIHELTHCVLESAINTTLDWHKQGLMVGVAVNMSAYSLQNDRITEDVRSILHNSGFPAQYLTLEITENAMMVDHERAVTILHKLSEMGVTISVDDYGTGFSSLGYLKQLPVKELKIDKSFVMDIIDDENDAVIVRSTIDLAHNLGLQVVAEGVESREIWDLLQMLGCDTAQGFYMSMPCDAESCTQWLKAPKLLPVLGKEERSFQSM